MLFQHFSLSIKGIYDVAKITLFCVFGVMQYVYAVQKHIIFHILYIIVAPMPHLSEKQRFYKANRSEKRGVLWLASYPGALWLAEYLRRVTEVLRPSHVVMPCPGLFTVFGPGATRLKQSNIQWGHNYWL